MSQPRDPRCLGGAAINALRFREDVTEDESQNELGGRGRLGEDVIAWLLGGQEGGQVAPCSVRSEVQYAGGPYTLKVSATSFPALRNR
jgi:hypothetical protein